LGLFGAAALGMAVSLQDESAAGKTASLYRDDYGVPTGDTPGR